MNAVARSEKRGTTQEIQPSSQSWLTPRVNIVETKEAHILEAEMPGVSKDGLEVLLEGNQLTLIGRRRRENLEAQLIYRESSQKDFHRVFALDPTIDTASVEAKIENGLLTLRLPKAEKVRPRRIAVSN